MSKRLQVLVGILGVLILTGTIACPAEAQSKLQEVLQRGKLIVGTGSTNPPWHFRDEKGELVGYDIDIAKMIAKGLFNDENKIEFVTQASDARIPNITTGKVDITCQFMTVTAGAGPAGRIHDSLLSRGRRPAAAEGRQITPITMRSKRPEIQGHRLSAAERLCRGHGASGSAGGQGRPI